MVERVRAWTYARQRLAGDAPDIGAALRDVTAVYSTHPTAPLALLARCRAMDRADFDAMDAAKTTVRLAGMRGTIFLMPREAAPAITGATAAPIASQGRRLAYAGLDWDGYARLKARILDIAREPVTPDQLAAALGDALPPGAKLMPLVRLIALEGQILRLGAPGGSLRLSVLRYVATEAWLGEAVVPASPEAGLAWLADAYLRGYGPARVEDVAWWAGVGRRRAAAALASIPTVDLGGGLLLPAADAAAFAATPPLDPDAIAVLPKWDAYTMGHAPDGRARFVAEAHRPLAYSRGGGGTLPGDGFPLILRGGIAVARWGHTFAAGTMRVTILPFAPGLLPERLLDGAFAGIGRILGATAITLAWEPPA